MGSQGGIVRSSVSGLLSLLAMVVWVTAAAAQEACVEAAARVVSLQGTVEFQNRGEGAWRPAVLDQRLCAGDVVRVGSVGRAALALANESVLRLDRGTTLRLQTVEREERSLLDLLTGSINFFARQPRSLAVDTPYLNAAVEGTEFLIRVADQRTRVSVFQGTVRAANDQGELLLASGDSAIAAEGEAPRAEIVARPRDAVAWALYYPPVLAPLAGNGGGSVRLPPGLQNAIERVAANDYEGALGALDQVPEAARDARYFVYRAGVLLNVGMVEDAELAIARALELDPTSADALAERAILRVAQNRRDEGLADAMRAVELDPGSVAAAIALSYALQAQFRLEEAREVLREASASFPDDPLVWARLAEIELSFGELGRAEEAAGRAVALAPGLARTQMVLGFADLVRIDYEEAKVAFQRAIELDSAEPMARLGLGLAIIRGGELDAGRAELEIAAGLDPDDSLLRSYLGKAYFEERRDLLAGEQYAVAKELDPNDPTPWFYDAIRLQLDNRPVEALRDLETAIALNDNRAVYRSRLLLDEDLAVRQTSLARIYDDLGFEQLGIQEASRSLALDPGNYSAHRFMSDSHAQIERQEIGRASELLQAQLLQPISINPVQPSAPLTDLNIVAGAGPAEASFDEYTPLFDRNGLAFNGTGFYGNNETRGDELIFSGIVDKLSVSLGQFHSQTDGFRSNNDVENNLYDVFAQYAITPELSVQAEYRHRDTDQGDLVQSFDPDSFSDNARRKLKNDVGRVGLHWAPTPSSDVLMSLFYIDRDETNNEGFFIAGFPPFFPDVEGVIGGPTDDKGYQGEGQYLWRGESVNLIAGGAYYDIDVDQEITADPCFFDPDPCVVSKSKSERKSTRGYTYGNLALPYNVTATVGLSGDVYEEDKLDENRVNPKLGLRWDVTDRVALRLAYFWTLKPALAVQQTLEPTTIAGFNQFFDDFNGSKAESFAAGVDVRLTSDVYGGVEYWHRDVSQPIFSADGSADFEQRDEDAARAYVYWTPHARWSVGAEVVYENFHRGKSNDDNAPKNLDQVSVPLSVRYFDPSGVFGKVGLTYLYQDVKRDSGSTEADGDDGGFLLDAIVGWRLPQRYGMISLEGRNLLDRDFDYQDLNYISSEQRLAPVIPDRTILGRLTLSF